MARSDSEDVDVDVLGDDDEENVSGFVFNGVVVRIVTEAWRSIILGYVFNHLVRRLTFIIIVLIILLVIIKSERQVKK